jgi:biopolymer transport protein ExbD
MRRRLEDSPEIPIAPMIDCVFLMLVYFMTTSSLEKSEADLAFPAGAAGIPSDPLPAIDEQRLAIAGDHTVLWNGARYDIAAPSGTALLVERLNGFDTACRAAGATPSLRIEPEAAAPHQAVVTVLDAAARAGLETIHFP